MSFNNSTSCKLPDDVLHDTGLVLFLVVGFVIMAVSLVANSLIIVAFSRTKSLRKPSNVLLANLAQGDIFVSLVGFPIYVLPDCFPRLHCTAFFHEFELFVRGCLVNLSFHTVQGVAIERFIAIQFPYKYPLVVDMKFCYILSVVTYIFSIVREMLSLLYKSVPSFSKAFDSIPIIPTVTGIATVAIYIRLYIVSRRHLTRDKQYGIVSQESRALTSVLIAFLYCLSWFPGTVIVIIRASVDIGQWGRLPYMFLMLGTCFNLGVYSYRMKDFRIAIKSLIGRKNVVIPQPRDNLSVIELV